MIAYSFWHSPAGGVAVVDYEAALSVFLRELGKASIPGLTRFLTVRFEQLSWVAGRPAYQDWYELEDAASLDSLEAGAVHTDMKAPHAAIARLAGDGTGGLFTRRSERSGPERGAGSDVWIAWADKPAGVPYPPFVAGLREVTEPGGTVWQRRLSLGPAREFCLWLPDVLRKRQGQAGEGLAEATLIARGLVIASSADRSAPAQGRTF